VLAQAHEISSDGIANVRESLFSSAPLRDAAMEGGAFRNENAVFIFID
jgi:hypothetical protein